MGWWMVLSSRQRKSCKRMTNYMCAVRSGMLVLWPYMHERAIRDAVEHATLQNAVVYCSCSWLPGRPAEELPEFPRRPCVKSLSKCDYFSCRFRVFRSAQP